VIPLYVFQLIKKPTELALHTRSAYVFASSICSSTLSLLFVPSSTCTSSLSICRFRTHNDQFIFFLFVFPFVTFEPARQQNETEQRLTLLIPIQGHVSHSVPHNDEPRFFVVGLSFVRQFIQMQKHFLFSLLLSPTQPPPIVLMFGVFIHHMFSSLCEVARYNRVESISSLSFSIHRRYNRFKPSPEHNRSPMEMPMNALFSMSWSLVVQLVVCGLQIDRYTLLHQKRANEIRSVHVCLCKKPEHSFDLFTARAWTNNVPKPTSSFFWPVRALHQPPTLTFKPE
jgi:hypothetical protein